jgi:CP family cyanate transporter-like MFS transporter
MESILKEALSLSHSQVSFLFSAPALMVVATAIPAGIVADRIGVRRAVGIGLVVMVAGAVTRGMVDSYAGLLASMFIFGGGFAWTFTNLPKIVSTFAGRVKAVVTMGLVNSGMPVGTALGMALTIPVILPIMQSYQGVFLVWSIPTVVVAALWWVIVREPEPGKLLGGFPKPVKTQASFRTVVRNRNVVLISVLMFLHNFFIWSWTGWAPTLLMLKGASPGLAGLIASMTIWVIIPTFLLMPGLSYRLGLRKPFLWIPSVVLALTAWLATQASVLASWFIMALAGVAAATRFTTLFTLPIEIMPREDVGTASGIMLSLGYTGAVIGPLVGGRILDSSQSLNKMLLVLVFVSVAAAVVSLRIPETGTRPMPEPVRRA